jgi:DmsE family decaheme c-type cytochrome
VAAGSVPLLFIPAVMLGANAENPCAPCHVEQVEIAAKGPHAGVAVRGPAYCESCHGPSAKHLQSGAAADIRGKTVLKKTAKKVLSQWCLSCHRPKFPGWEGGPHARSAEITCTSCHADAWHDAKGKSVARRGSSSCAECHEDEVASFRRVYRHPVLEGKMSCASCHDVHGKSAAGTKGAEAKCLDCHGEVAGPYVFPHRASEDGCTSCHTPHGSVNRGLLKTAGNGLCLNCHVQANFPAAGKVPHNRLLQGGGKCLDCHSEVHGSNVDELMAPRWRRK